MLNVRWKNSTFAPAFETSEHWRDGRVVDYSSLENYRTERYRGFESLSLRKEFSTMLNSFFVFLLLFKKVEEKFGRVTKFSYFCSDE